ncbi:MAG: ester cyclase [Gammaproteobacteria bacterium]|nr:ester cyclase [Gammaproteobacteria bacterium]
MSAEQNKQLIRHIMEDGFNKQDMAVVNATFHNDYVRHGHGVGSMGSLAEHIEDLKARHQSFDDAHFVINQIVADGDTVAVHYTFNGVHTGTFNGIAPTGRRISRPSAAFFTVRDGKVAEGHIFADGAGLVAQLTE